MRLAVKPFILIHRGSKPPQHIFMDFLIKLLQVILSLSILVVLHEGGHFLPAKWFKTRVEKFYLFFNPGFELFKKKIGETEYGIGWLPFGGYVKIAGMIDESFDKEQMQGEPQPWEFRSKPAWQRFIIMVGGVTVNLILGVLLFIMIYGVYGVTYIDNASVTNGIYVDSIGYDIGLRTGDKVLKYGDTEFTKFSPGAVISAIVIDSEDNITVERDGKKLVIPVDPKFTAVLSGQKMKSSVFFEARTPYEVSSVSKARKILGLVSKGEDGPAAKAGIEPGDKIISLNNQEIQYYDQTMDIVRTHRNQEIPITVLRNGQVLQKMITPDENGMLGVRREATSKYFETKTQDYTWAEAIPAGWDKATGFLAGQGKAFKKMFTGEIKAKDSLGSIISIGNLFPSSWNWRSFWNLTAMLSLILGVMNLLPIPALDGGYIVFLLWEMISGRKVSDRTMEIANTIGFFLLIGLMIFALGLDISRLF